MAYHDFRASEGGADFGREADVMLSVPLWQKTVALLKFAYFDAASHARDTTKVWLMLTYRL